MKHPGHTYGGFVPAISERGLTQIKIEGRNFVKGDDGYVMTKLMKALLQGGREWWAHGSSKYFSKQLEATGQKYYEEYDKLDCDLTDMWRMPTSTERGLQTCPNWQIYMGESAHKYNSEFNSSPIRNPGEVDLKTDAQVAYDVR
jgi:hypothetical protein